jgi:hypothetical protein
MRSSNTDLSPTKDGLVLKNAHGTFHATRCVAARKRNAMPTFRCLFGLKVHWPLMRSLKTSAPNIECSENAEFDQACDSASSIQAV